MCTDFQVKKVLSQTIIAMAHHGYLEMEGGQLMLDFVARQCTLPPDTVSFKHDVSAVTSQQQEADWSSGYVCHKLTASIYYYYYYYYYMYFITLHKSLQETNRGSGDSHVISS